MGLEAERRPTPVMHLGALYRSVQQNQCAIVRIKTGRPFINGSIKEIVFVELVLADSLISDSRLVFP